MNAFKLSSREDRTASFDHIRVSLSFSLSKCSACLYEMNAQAYGFSSSSKNHKWFRKMNFNCLNVPVEEFNMSEVAIL